jgi:uncharacterized protein YqeY
MSSESSPLKGQILEAVKAAMKAGDKRRVGALRLVTAAIKQREVDERTDVDDTQVLAILDKMVKQRRESLAQYEAAGRGDLAAQEAFEIELIQGFMPRALTAEELGLLIDDAIAQVGASSVKDMGRVVGVLRPKVQGRSDMGEVSAMVKARLGG